MNAIKVTPEFNKEKQTPINIDITLKTGSNPKIYPGDAAPASIFTESRFQAYLIQGADGFLENKEMLYEEVTKWLARFDSCYSLNIAATVKGASGSFISLYDKDDQEILNFLKEAVETAESLIMPSEVKRTLPEFQEVFRIIDNTKA
ncbi:MAG: hypothetical protein ACT4OY_09225 [Alphaproteobacteria bacterium]